MMTTGKNIKTSMVEFLNEQQNGTTAEENFIKNITYNGRKLKLYKVEDEPMKIQLYLDTMDGESYIDINKILPQNMLDDAIWVEIGGKEEQIADSLGDILEKTDRITNSGYNKYVMYKIV